MTQRALRVSKKRVRGIRSREIGGVGLGALGVGMDWRARVENADAV